MDEIILNPMASQTPLNLGKDLARMPLACFRVGDKFCTHNCPPLLVGDRWAQV